MLVYWSVLEINANNILCLSSTLLSSPLKSFPHVEDREHKPDNHENRDRDRGAGQVQQPVSIKQRPGHCSPKGKIQHKRSYWWPRPAASFALCVCVCVSPTTSILTSVRNVALCSQWDRWKLHIDWKAALCPLYCWAANLSASNNKHQLECVSLCELEVTAQPLLLCDE